MSKKSTPSTNNNNAADSIYQTQQQTKLTPQHAGVSVGKFCYFWVSFLFDFFYCFFLHTDIRLFTIIIVFIKLSFFPCAHVNGDGDQVLKFITVKYARALGASQ